MKKYIAAIILVLVALLGLNNSGFFLNPEYPGFWALLSAGVIVFFMLPLFINNRVTDKQKKSAIIGIAAGIIMFSGVLLLKSEFLNDTALYNSLKIEKKDIKDLNISKQRVVTRQMALKLANKVIGGKYKGVQISSQYEINRDMGSVQIVNDKLVWVFPLDFSSFVKYLKQGVTPGYVVVSATDPMSQPNLVLGKEMSVSKNAYGMHSVDRIMFLKSGLKDVETHFEINEEGNPFFIGLVQEPKNGFTNLDTTKVILLNATNGEAEIFASKEEAEKTHPWIDRLISEVHTEERITWYGSLSQGWGNTIIGGENINKPTSYKGRELWFVEINGQPVFFTGMTSTNSKDSSLVSGIAVNTKNGSAIEFDLSGAMDESGAVAALDSGLGADAQKWEPVLPQPFVKDGKFYWGSPIVSSSNIFQKVGIVNAYQQGEVYYAKSYDKALSKVGFKSQSVDSKETIEINKEAYLKLLQKIDELNELKRQLLE